MILLKKFFALFRRRKLDADMADEMRAHLELQAQENLAQGMTPDEARFAARRQFGGVEQIKECVREQRGWPWLEQFLVDIRFSMRSLNRAPGFSVGMIVTLVLGIGAATAAFSFTAKPLFGKAPYPNPGELMAIGWMDKWTPFGLDLSGLQLLAYQDQTNVFAAYAAIEGRMANVVVDGDPAPANHIAISADGFRTLGIVPVLGRGFLPQEYQERSDNVVVVTDSFWRTRLKADISVLGREILIDQQPCKIVGVLAPGQLIPFRFQGDVYRPLFFTLGPKNRTGPGIHVVARLQRGVSPEAARAALAQVQFPALPPELSHIPERAPVVMPIDEIGGRTMWWVIFAAGLFLFAISCLNAMNLMLVRVLGRMREFSIRLAVGCGRVRLARLLLIDGGVVAIISGGMVLLAARAWFEPLCVWLDGDPDASYDLFARGATVGGIAGLCLVAATAMAVAPIWHVSKASVNGGLKTGAGATGDNRRTGNLRSGFVALQAALAVILLVGTGLMVRTLQRLQAVELGFDPVGKVKVEVVFPRGLEPKPAVRLQYFERLRQRVAAIPGVKSAAFGEDALLIGGYYAPAPNFQMRDGTYQSVAVSFLSADYAATAGMQLRRGRWFSGRGGETEAVINETLARSRFGDADPVGQSFKFRGYREREFQVVGVVRDVRETVRDMAGLRFYLPDSMVPSAVSALILRLDREPAPAFKGVVRRAIYDFDPMLITNYVASLQERTEGSWRAERLTLVILRGLAVIALILAVVGLGSVMAYSVGARTREFGVRLALGALPSQLYRAVLLHGLATVALGVLAGTAVAIGATRALQTLLFETTTYDPGVYVAVTGLLLLSGTVACWLPARRAAKVDPMVALRAE